MFFKKELKLVFNPKGVFTLAIMNRSFTSQFVNTVTNVVRPMALICSPYITDDVFR